MISAFHADVPGSNAGQVLCQAEDPGGRTIFLTITAAGNCQLFSSEGFLLLFQSLVRLLSSLQEFHHDCYVYTISVITKNI